MKWACANLGNWAATHVTGTMNVNLATQHCTKMNRNIFTGNFRASDGLRMLTVVDSIGGIRPQKTSLAGSTRQVRDQCAAAGIEPLQCHSTHNASSGFGGLVQRTRYADTSTPAAMAPYMQPQGRNTGPRTCALRCSSGPLTSRATM